MVRIVPMREAHATPVLAIYEAGIRDGDSTFETETPSWERFDAGKSPEHRFVALRGEEVVGWVACAPVSTRPAYAGVVEDSVYVRPDARGAGVGKTLLRALVESTEAAGVWTIQAGIFPENAASLGLHARAGFRVVGRRERLGNLRGAWRDVVLVERRSPRVG